MLNIPFFINLFPFYASGVNGIIKLAIGNNYDGKFQRSWAMVSRKTVLDAFLLAEHQQEDFWKSIYKGVVNDKFNETLSLKRTGEPDCVVQMIETYFADVEMLLSELSCHVDNPKADFCKLASLAREIKDRSTSIGTEHMRVASSDLVKACDEKHPKNFSRNLSWLKNEFNNTRNKLGAFIQMERRIIRLESSQSSN